MQAEINLRQQDQDRRSRRLLLNVLIHGITLFVLNALQSPAGASCGDYLQHHRMSGFGESDLNLAIQDSDDLPDRFPSCRQTPPVSPVEPPMTAPDFNDRWDRISVVSIPANDDASYLARRPERITLPAYAERLERPPRDH